jgi:PleD family two-component response regulator
MRDASTLQELYKISEEDIHLIQGLGEFMLPQMDLKDGLTKVANRRYFDQQLEYEWGRLKREKQPLSLILMDVDFFKFY